MSALRSRHEARDSWSPACVVAFGLLVAFSMALGGLRLHCLNVEHRISEISMRIEATRDQNAVLEERLSALLSPARIYTFARNQLGMTNVKTVEVIRMQGNGGIPRSRVAEGNPDRRRVRSSLLLSQANAQD